MELGKTVAARVRMRGVSATALIVVLAIAAGVVLRVWLIVSAPLDVDEAIVGLMARHVLHGEFPTFFWHQAYGGAQEAYLTAPLFALFGSGKVVLRTVPAVLYAGSAVLVWRVGLRTVGARAAVCGALLFWIWPAAFAWKSTRAHLFYGSELLLSLTVLLFALRLASRDSRRDLAALGLAVGLAFWSSPQTALVVLPVLVWLVSRRPSVIRGIWLAAPAAALGAAPWLAWSVGHHFASIHSQAGGSTGGYLYHLRVFFSANLPTALGLRVPISLHWLVWPLLGRALVALALLAFAVAALTRKHFGPLLPIAAAYPLLLAFSPYSWRSDDPRYLLLLAPVTALLLGALLARRRLQVASVGLAAALTLTMFALADLRHSDLDSSRTDGRTIPDNLAPLLNTLQKQGLRHVYTSYEIAYRIDFESGERLVAAPADQRKFSLQHGSVRPAGPGPGRYRPYDALLRATPYPPSIFLAGSRAETTARQLFTANGYRRITLGGFAIYTRS